MKKILILGASSYVGSSFIKELSNENYITYVLTRNQTHNFLISDDLSKIRIINENNLRDIKNFDLIINFAYVKNYCSKRDAINKTLSFFNFLIDIVNSSKNCFFIHISSIAVHDHKKNKNDGYIAGKVLAEKLIYKKCKIPFCIIRIGNIMGEYAPNWTGTIVNKIINLETFTDSEWGYSNTTYIGNLIDFLLKVINNDKIKSRNLYQFVEFNDIKWNEWVFPIANKLEIPFDYLTTKTYNEVIKDNDLQKKIKVYTLNKIIKPIGKKLIELNFFTKKINEWKFRIPINLFNNEKINLSLNNNFKEIISSNICYQNIYDFDFKKKYSFEEALNKILLSID